MITLITTTNTNKNKYKQTGATLVTSLIFLLLMTIVSVSATKMSMLDILVSSNEQQQMVLFQTTENQLKQLTSTEKLNDSGLMASAILGHFTFTDSPTGVTETITDIPNTPEKGYPCERGGKATSTGAGTQFHCDLYDFQVSSRAGNSSARDRHHQGAGKMKPVGAGKGHL